MNFAGTKWPAQLDSRLVELVKTGKGSGEIALLLNVEFGTKITRNSVGGRVFRMRKTLPEHAELRLTYQHGKSGDEWGGRKITTEERREASRRRWQRWEASQSSSTLDAIRAARAAATKRRNAERKLAMKTQTSANAVHILDARHDQCRWPLWCDGAPFSELNFCGNPKEAGSSYCPAHAFRSANFVRGEFVPVKGNRWSIGHSWKTAGAGRAA